MTDSPTLPARFTQDLTDGPSFEMILVQGGDFMMGGSDANAKNREKPIHLVRLSTYYLATFPVIQTLWQAVMKKNPSRFKGENHPVDSVSWEDAQMFLKQLKQETGKSYRLPTEAEWEFAARGGIQAEGYLYAGSDKLKEVGLYDDNEGNGTQPVGLLLPNELGLYDMSGNVQELCEDWYSREYYQVCLDRNIIENPSGPIKGSHRVFRGGDWYKDRDVCDCRVSSRTFGGPDGWYGDIGFRLALSP